MIMMLSCKKNWKKVERSKRVWLDKCGIPYVVLMGDPNIQNSYEYDSGTRVLTVQCPDDYESLSWKVYLGYKTLYMLFRPTGILKVDDDVLVRINRIQEFSRVPSKPSYIGSVATFVGYMSNYHKSKVYDDELSNKLVYVPNVKYCNGAMYYIDAEAIRCLMKNMNPDDHIYEDVLVGKTLNACNIYPVQFPWITNHLTVFLMNTEYIAYHDVNSSYNFSYLIASFNMNRSITEWFFMGLLFYIAILLILTLLFFHRNRIIYP